MSSFIKELKHPKTGKLQKALCIDGYFGGRRYGYGFTKDGTDVNFEDYKNDELEFFKESELNN